MRPFAQKVFFSFEIVAGWLHVRTVLYYLLFYETKQTNSNKQRLIIMPESSSYFERVANDVLEASEKLVNGVEEGLAILFAGGNGGATTPSPAEDVSTSRDEEEEWDETQMTENLMQSSPLGGIAESVIGNILDGQKRPETFLEHFHAFRYAIAWSEPFVLGMVTFQVVMFLLTLYVSRKNQRLAPRVILMLFILGMVRLAERWNDMGSQHWRSFATQNYFDRRGIFVSILLCAPLLLDSLLMMVLFLREASQLLVEVKTVQLNKRKKQQTTSSKKEKREKKPSKKDQ